MLETALMWLSSQFDLINGELWFWIAVFSAINEIAVYVLPASIALKIPTITRLLYLLTKAIRKFNEVIEKAPYTKAGFDNELDKEFLQDNKKH